MHYAEKRCALPEWELALSSAARRQRILPKAVLAGVTASAIHGGHRFSRDADHVPTDPRHRFDEALVQLELVAGWKTARIQCPVRIFLAASMTSTQGFAN
jgi:hypothetical protein